MGEEGQRERDRAAQADSLLSAEPPFGAPSPHPDKGELDSQTFN